MEKYIGENPMYFRDWKWRNTLEMLLEIASRPATPFSVVSRLYHPNVIDHYDNPRNVGSFDKNDPNVWYRIGRSSSMWRCNVMKLQVKFDGAGQIIDARFENLWLWLRIAASSVATEWVKGKSVEEVLTIKNSHIAKHLSLPPVKLHCSMLAEDAIKAAVKNYKEKQAEANGETVEA